MAITHNFFARVARDHACCGPLSGVFPGNVWPLSVRREHLTNAEMDRQEADRYLDFAKTKGIALSEFVDWLDENGMGIVRFGEDGQTHQHVQNFEKLFAAFAGIDLEAVERYRRRVLAEMQVEAESNDPEASCGGDPIEAFEEADAMRERIRVRLFSPKTTEG